MSIINILPLLGTKILNLTEFLKELLTREMTENLTKHNICTTNRNNTLNLQFFLCFF